MKYLIGLDSGGTYTKAVVYTTAGNQVGSAKVSIPTVNSLFENSERNKDVIYNLTCKCIKNAIRSSMISPSLIIGIGISGHGKGLYTLSKNKNYEINGILSIDNRAAAIVENWIEKGVDKQAKAISFQNILACQPVAILRWLKENKREYYDSIETVFSIKDYLRYRLTGVKAQEITDASGCNIINMQTKQYDNALLELFGIEEMKNCFPPLIKSTDIGGKITKDAAKKTGLCENVIVSGGLFDIDACGIGAGMIDDTRLTMIAGTWSINEYLSSVLIDVDKIGMNSIYALDKYYLVEECSQTGAGNLEWFIRKIIKQQDYNKLNALVESSDINNDVYFMPYLYGSNVSKKATGTFIGLTDRTTIADMTRAIYEGTAFAHRLHYDKLLTTRDKPRAIRLAGGVVKSKIWTEIFSNVLDCDIELICNAELGTLGACITAGVAAGEYKNIEDGVKKIIRVDCVIHPQTEKVNIYKYKYARYCEFVKALNSCW